MTNLCLFSMVSKYTFLILFTLSLEVTARHFPYKCTLFGTQEVIISFEPILINFVLYIWHLLEERLEEKLCKRKTTFFKNLLAFKRLCMYLLVNYLINIRFIFIVVNISIQPKRLNTTNRIFETNSIITILVSHLESHFECCFWVAVLFCFCYIHCKYSFCHFFNLIFLLFFCNTLQSYYRKCYR